MLIKDIKKITLEDARELSKKGIFFIIHDGKLKGFTK